MPLLKSSELTSGRTLSRMVSPAIRGREVQLHAELLEDDRDRAGRALDDRDRKFAAGEEAGLLAVVGDQVRLGQASGNSRSTRAP